jgi:hypothetical protein
VGLTPRRPLTPEQIESTTSWIAAQQEASGEIPWWLGGKMDPWDHVHSAMALTVAGRLEESAAAFRFLVESQRRNGAWPAARDAGVVTDETTESNHAAYVATGLWHYFVSTGDVDFLAECWPMVDRAIDFVVSMQAAHGAISWAVDAQRNVWTDPLLTGSSSIHGSLVCATRIAERLDHERPRWGEVRERLAEIVRDEPQVFTSVTLPEPVGRYSMDWYYPVLGGALRGERGRRRLLDPSAAEVFVAEGVGLRCVSDEPWYTVAETCEFVLALAACGLTERAWQVFSWMRPFRHDSGAYWTGKTHPEGVFWPEEFNAWTAATVVLAADALADDSPTSAFFATLAGDDLADCASRSAANA